MTDTPQTAVVFVTVPSTEVGEKLAQDIVAGQLAGCVNIVPSVRSVYRWEGKVCLEAESLLMIKTTHAALPALERFICDHHPYETPEFVVVGADYVEPRYAAWIAHAVK